MLLQATQKEKPAGVLIDRGTGKRIPLAFKADMDTGEWEAHVPAPNGTDIQADELHRPMTCKGRAVGKLELVSMEGAEHFGVKPPQLVDSPVVVITKDMKLAGLDSYKRTYFQVWNNFRGEAQKCVNDRFSDYLKKNQFLDTFCIRRRSVR